MTKMARYWVNAPSGLQGDHHNHGLRVIAPKDLKGLEVVDAYPVDGPIHSLRLFTLTLSPGWPATG
jgi:hypothetical protein